jgi:polysaccharide biosynthesis transport protein
VVKNLLSGNCNKMLTAEGYRPPVPLSFMKAPKTSLPNPAFSPLSIARMLWKRKFSAGILGGVFALIGCLVVHRLPAIYSSEAVILVDSQKIPEKLVASTVSTDLQDRIQTISQQILSSAQLKKVIEDFDLYHAERNELFEEEILEKMRKDISITLEQGWTGNRPGAFRVGYRGTNPSVVAQVTNRLANLYIDENLKTREVQAEGTSEFISTQLQEAKKKLDELEAAMSKYKLAHNGELPQQETALIGALSRLQSELEANRDGINRSEQAKLVLDNTLSTLESTVSMLSKPSQPSSARALPTDGLGSGDADNRETKPKSEVLQAQLDLLRTRYSDNHPDVRLLRDEIARLKETEKKDTTSHPVPTTNASTVPDAAADLPQRPDRERPELRQARERASAAKAQMTLVNRDLEIGKNEQQRILHDMAQYQERVAKLPVREQEMAQLTRDYEISKANYRSLLDKELSAEMATDMERRQKSERFTVLDPARVPEKPIKPNRPLFYAFSLVGALVIGLAFGLGREFKRDVLLGEWELPQGLTVLGRLPYIEISPKDASNPAQSGGKRQRNRKLQLAVVFSAILSLLGIIVAGIYLFWQRG